MSKIYRIICRETGLCYIGSTDEYYLSIRMAKHRYDFKHKINVSSKLVMEKNDYYIELIEECEKDQRRQREQFWKENVDCVNYKNPYNSKEYKKKYGKEWYEKNREKMEKYHKDYREAHKEEIIERDKEKMTCECGSICRRRDKVRHCKSKKHQDYLANTNK